MNARNRPTAITIPDLDDPRVLRHVNIEGYRLLTWETNGRCDTGQQLLGYAFYAPGAGEPLFTGADYGCSPCHAIDSDGAVRGLLGFLTLRPGDTDEDYFANYTDAQHAFAAGDAESLSIYACEPESTEDVYEFTEVAT